MLIKTTCRIAMLACLGGIFAPAAGPWEGTFIGIHAGLAQARANYQTGPDDTSWFANNHVTSGMWAAGDQRDRRYAGAGGLSLGFGHQAGAFVYGADLAASLLKIKLHHSQSSPYFANGGHNYAYDQQAVVTGLYTLRAQAGYAFGRSLLTGAAGLAASSVRTGIHFSDDYAGTGQYQAGEAKAKLRVGWTLGLAFRHRLPGDTVIKAEWACMDLGKTSFATPVQAGDGTYVAPMNFTARVRLNTYLVGIEKRF